MPIFFSGSAILQVGVEPSPLKTTTLPSHCVIKVSSAPPTHICLNHTILRLFTWVQARLTNTDNTPVWRCFMMLLTEGEAVSPLITPASYYPHPNTRLPWASKLHFAEWPLSVLCSLLALVSGISLHQWQCLLYHDSSIGLSLGTLSLFLHMTFILQGPSNLSTQKSLYKAFAFPCVSDMNCHAEILLWTLWEQQSQWHHKGSGLDLVRDGKPMKAFEEPMTQQ